MELTNKLQLLISIFLISLLVQALIFFPRILYLASINNVFMDPYSRNEIISSIKSPLRTFKFCERPYLVIVVVSSTITNYDRRRFIRETWGSDSRAQPLIKTVFVVAQKENEPVNSLLMKESELFNDIIESSHIEDYYKQSLKIAVGFEWATKFCHSQFILKIDDDIFVNKLRLLEFLTSLSLLNWNSTYTGNLQTEAVVQREGRHKVSYTEYKYDLFSSFCSGGGFLISSNVASDILNFFDFKNYWTVDDAYIGQLVLEAGYYGTMSYFFTMFAYSCNYKHGMIAQHPATGACLFKLQKNVRNDPIAYKINWTLLEERVNILKNEFNNKYMESINYQEDYNDK